MEKYFDGALFKVITTFFLYCLKTISMLDYMQCRFIHFFIQGPKTYFEFGRVLIGKKDKKSSKLAS